MTTENRRGKGYGAPLESQYMTIQLWFGPFQRQGPCYLTRQPISLLDTFILESAFIGELHNNSSSYYVECQA